MQIAFKQCIAHVLYIIRCVTVHGDLTNVEQYVVLFVQGVAKENCLLSWWRRRLFMFVPERWNVVDGPNLSAK